MIDFPSNPTTGQIFVAPNGVAWTWDGAKWTSGATGSGFLPIAGGTMTGPLTLESDPTAALQASTKQYVDATNIRYRNRIINGDMSVDQRNGGAAIAVLGAVYSIDRWKAIASATPTNGTLQQISVGVPYLYGLQWKTTTAHTLAAGDYFAVLQSVEGFNFYDALWGTASAQSVVLEFWAQSSLTGTFGGVLQNGANTRSYAFTYSLPTANVWTKFRINIPGDTAGNWSVAANAAQLQSVFSLGVGVTYSTAPGAWVAGNFLSATGAVNVVGTLNATLNITGVALMVGAAAANAEPEFKSISENLLDCQRYYEKSYPYGNVAGAVTGSGCVYVLYNMSSVTTGVNASMGANFMVTKRILPTFSTYSPQTGGPGARDLANAVDVVFTPANAGDRNYNGYCIASLATAQPQFSMHWTADADF